MSKVLQVVSTEDFKEDPNPPSIEWRNIIISITGADCWFGSPHQTLEDANKAWAAAQSGTAIRVACIQVEK